MNLANKTFKNNVTGEIIKVIDSFENIVILENKQKMDMKSLMDVNKYTEQIDPANFFKNQGAYDILSEKIKNIPTHLMNDDNTQSININSDDNFYPNSNETAVVMTTEEDERAELARKYGVSNDNNKYLQKQNEAFAKILGDDSEELPKIPVRPFNDPEIQRVEVNREQNSHQSQPQLDDPIVTMFKKTKRNVDFKINVEISDKIPRLDFIEMMEDSYETSMIDFLADEFTNKILKDPSLIRNTIKDKIKQLVYGGEIKTPVNPQITDSVTQKHESLSIEKEPVLTKDLPKKTTTRKPRAKKETTEK